MFRISGEDKDVKWKIELYQADGETIKEVLQPFTMVEAQKKLRELGEPFGAKIKHIDA